MMKNILRCFFFCVLLVTCLPSQGMAEDNHKHNINILSYNICHGQGIDGKTDYSRIGEVIRCYAPDIVALQEVDSVTLRSEGHDVLKEIATRTGLYPTFAAAIPYEGGKYGVGILSRRPPLAVKRIPLPGREEKRVLLITEFRDYVFCCTHFSLTGEDQLRSVDIIYKALSGYDKPVFLAGDLNAEPHSKTISCLSEHFQIVNDTTQFTYPSDAPKQCIDYVMTLKNKSAGKTLAQEVVNAPFASDHRPVAITVENTVAPIFRTQPYLQNPVDNGITVTWLTNSKVYSWVEYGTDPNHLTQKAHTLVDGQVLCNNHLHKIRIDNLIPGQTYYYRAYSRDILSYQAYSKTFGETDSTEIYTFRLPEKNEDSFTAIVFNDLHKHNQTFRALCQQIENLHYDFVIFNGDCIDDPANESQAVDFLKFLNEGVKASQTPVFYLRGNHEIRNAYSIELRNLFDYVDNKTYGAFNWGDTRFLQLDCGEDKPDDTWVYYGLNDFEAFRHNQVDFLRNELKSKAFKKAKRRIIIHHVPIYGNDDEYNPCYTLWHPLLRKQPIDISINAHTHEFAFHEAGSQNGNTFPVLIGGGPGMEKACVTIVEKQGKRLQVRSLNTKGELLLEKTL